MDKKTDAYRRRMLEMVKENKEFYQCVDGYTYYLPDKENGGHLSSVQLRWIADELDRINKPWDDLITKELTGLAHKERGQWLRELWDKLNCFWTWAILVWGLILWAAYYFKD